MKVRQMVANDWPAVATIYKEGIDTGFATFEKNIPSYGEWSKVHMQLCRFVAEHYQKIVGWAALSPVSGRCVYGGIGEVSVYVSNDSRGLGVGKALMEHLIAASEKEGLWSLQSGIFPENKASIALHKKVGFRLIGKREKIGQLDGVWKDNILMERRSRIVGITP